MRRGEGWITVTSPLEGTSYVNVVAPEIHNSDIRRKTAVVHSVDAVAQYSAAGDQPGWHETRLHYHGDAQFEPVALRKLDCSVRNRRWSAGRLPAFRAT